MTLEIICCSCRKKKLREEVAVGYNLPAILKKYKWKGIKAGYLCEDCNRSMDL